MRAYEKYRFGKSPVPWDADLLDNKLCPSHSASPEGVAQLHHKDGWTALAFWDRSVDSRPGSHSTFFTEGTHDFTAMVEICKRDFPEVWARYPFEITEWVPS
jgi:hypothetical protein